MWRHIWKRGESRAAWWNVTKRGRGLCFPKIAWRHLWTTPYALYKFTFYLLYLLTYLRWLCWWAAARLLLALKTTFRDVISREKKNLRLPNVTNQSETHIVAKLLSLVNIDGHLSITTVMM